MSTLIEQLLNGLTLGSIYSLVALGYTMVYGILLMINFAHSEIFMAGAFLGWLTLKLTSALPAPVSIALSLIVGMAGCGLLAVGIEKCAYAPLRRAPRLAPLISAIGISIILQNAVFLWRNDFLAFPLVFPQIQIPFGSIQISLVQIVILGSSFLLMTLLWFFVNKSRLGQAMRACSQDREAAELMGIPVNQIISVTFFIGALLGGAGGILYGLYYGSPPCSARAKRGKGPPGPSFSPLPAPGRFFVT